MNFESNWEMAQELASIIYKNVLPWRGCEKLYLDTRTADVFFVFEFDGEETVKLPAHKSILSANSETFDAMFYGLRKQEGDIPIVDSTPEAFKEFLQFFYLATLKLTVENVEHVMNLGKQYLVDECCMVSSTLTEQTLTLDTMVWGYELAILFDQHQLKNFCEHQISANPQEIFKSSSFLSCGSNLLARILQLEPLNCDESVVFDGCMEWAKAACIRNGLDETNSLNIRSQLGDLFYEIRFNEMSAENFYTRYRCYENLFSLEEFKDIIEMTVFKDNRTTRFNRNSRKLGQVTKKCITKLICDRIDRNYFDNKRYNLQSNGSSIQNITSFTSNCELLLETIYCVELFQNLGEKPIPNLSVEMDLIDSSNGKILYSHQAMFQPLRETIIQLSTPIAIHPGVKYEINFLTLIGKWYSLKTLNNKVKMVGGVEIEFHNDNTSLSKKAELVKKLSFMKLDE